MSKVAVVGAGPAGCSAGYHLKWASCYPARQKNVFLKTRYAAMALAINPSSSIDDGNLPDR